VKFPRPTHPPHDPDTAVLGSLRTRRRGCRGRERHPGLYRQEPGTPLRGSHRPSP